MRILLVEDDDRIAAPLMEDLRHQQHVIDWAQDGLIGWDCAQVIAYDLILLDLMLPKLDGISLCKQLRADRYSGFILMLTAKDTTTDRVIGLDAGADDYLVKPFELEELAARIRALARRPPQLTQPVLQQGKLQLNPTTHKVNYAGEPIELTPKEFLLLKHFMQHPGQVFTRSMILDKLWELDQDSGEGTIRTHINNLRRKLERTGSHESLIETVYGVGYRFNNQAS
ncbi:MAG: response regulator transcription factor [Leptolyngbya sp. SIO1D8]|nr:response regulator transcription factor [Leptolyngbya sp. SIO1D8]